ncbi:MAG: class I SAM-dependent methyltransferase [Armatimonadetes bacterium]|nr:class I SAM-dependent methyltransferase [Armatimonadota bacterium]
MATQEVSDRFGLKEGHPPERACSRFLKWFYGEARGIPGVLEDELFAAIYERLAVKRKFSHWNYCRRVAHGIRAIRSFTANGKTPRILDAGSGFGDKTILFALSGAQAVGYEILPNKLSVAGKMLTRSQEAAGGSLEASFVAKSAFESEGPFDIIFIMEAISHIHPAEGFLSRIREILSPGGKLIITDSNRSNPLIVKALEKRVGKDLGRVEEIEGHLVANERVFSGPELKGMIEKAGFAVSLVDWQCLVPPGVFQVMPYGVGCGLDRFLSQLPILRRLGVVFTIIAEPVTRS